MRESPRTAFCSSAGVILAYGAVAQGRTGHFDEARALVERIPLNAIDEITRRDLVTFGLAFAGEPAEGEIASTVWGGVTAVASRAHEQALAIANEFAGFSRTGAHFYGALADAIREEVAHDRGGPTPTHRALRQIGYVGWGEVLSARV
jgi:hypothetical protein